MDAYNTFVRTYGRESIAKVSASINSYVNTERDNLTPAEAFAMTALKHELDIYLMTDGDENPAVSSLRADMANDSMGILSNAALKSDKRVASALEYMESQFSAGTLGARIIGRLKQLSIDNDLHLELLSNSEMDARFGTTTQGIYDNETGALYMRDGMSFNAQVHALVHETTHAFFNQKAFAYSNYKDAQARGLQTSPSQFGLTTADLDVLSDMESLMEKVRGSDVFNHPRYSEVARLTNEDGTSTPYGLSFDANSHHAVAEFAAELFSSEPFRNAVAEAAMRADSTNLRTWKDRIRALMRKVAQFLGFTTQGDVNAVANAIENGLTVLSEVPYKAVRAGTSALKKDDAVERNKFIIDHEKGIQYYQFKRATGVEGPAVAEASAYRQVDETGKLLDTWSLSYRNPNNVAEWVQEDGLTISELSDRVNKLDYRVLNRNGNTRITKHVNEQIDKVWALHPRLAKTLLKLREWMSTISGQEAADNFLDTAVGVAMKLEYYTQDRDVMLTWATRMAVAKYGKDNVPQDLQNEANVIRAAYHNYMTERGITGLTGYDHKKLISDYVKKLGWTEQFTSDVVYAAMARERAKQFKENPGGINPYTGEHWRDTNHVSGFKFTDKNGNKVADEDGSLFFASLDVEQQRQVDEFIDMWIKQNDTLTDLEYMSGVISTETYEQRRGVFYAPLKNEWDKETAFNKMARGRTTQAKDPFTNWYAHAEMRVAYALRQRENQYLLEAGQEYGLGALYSVNQTSFVGKNDAIGMQWQAPNMSDGTSWTVFKNGIPYTLTIKDPTIQKAYRSTRNWEDRAAIWKYLSNATRFMSTVRTTLSPGFLPVAYARDLATAMVNMQAAFRSMNGDQVLSDKEAAKLAPLVVRRAVTSLPAILKGKWTGNRQWQYDVFKRYGGGVVMNARMDFEEYNGWLNENAFTKGMTTKQMALNSAKKGITKLSEISHALEDSTRFATFMEFVEHKAGHKFADEKSLISFLESNPDIKKQAINGSKNITGNFEIKGGSTSLRSLYMFFNAGMVGARTFVHMFDPSHGTHGVKAAATIFGLALASLAAVDGDLGDDEDGKAKGARVKLTESSLCMGMAGCIQMPHELRWITSTARALHYGAKGDIDMADAVRSMANNVFQVFVPLQFGEDMTRGDDLAMGVLPTILQPLAQNLLNRDSFGNPIVNQYAYRADGSRIMDAPDWMKTKVSDPYVAKELALQLSKIGLDVSSSEITHMFQQALGGVGSTALKVIRGIENGESGAETMGKVFFNGFIPRYDNQALKKEVQEKIADLKSELSRGTDGYNMVKNKADLQADSRWNTLVALEKQLQNMEKGISFNGMSYASAMRQKLTAQQSGDVDAILAADNALDIMGEERRKVYGAMLTLFDELEGNIGE
nr:MAG TPA: Large polyvalent protein associated domain 38 [Caudoviricetes sp.]